MIVFKTETGSVYELDEQNKRIRRVTGAKPVTRYQAGDGVWKKYAEISPVDVGVKVMIVWSYDDLIPATFTSVVESMGN